MSRRRFVPPFSEGQVGWCRFHQDNVLDRLFRFCNTCWDGPSLRDCDMVRYV